MAPHEQRVLDEKNALDDKISKLYKFFETDIFVGLPRAEQDRLSRQYQLMVQYSDVLKERIDWFNSQ